MYERAENGFKPRRHSELYSSECSTYNLRARVRFPPLWWSGTFFPSARHFILIAALGPCIQGGPEWTQHLRSIMPRKRGIELNCCVHYCIYNSFLSKRTLRSLILIKAFWFYGRLSEAMSFSIFLFQKSQLTYRNLPLCGFPGYIASKKWLWTQNALNKNHWSWCHFAGKRIFYAFPTHWLIRFCPWFLWNCGCWVLSGPPCIHADGDPVACELYCAGWISCSCLQNCDWPECSPGSGKRANWVQNRYRSQRGGRPMNGVIIWKIKPHICQYMHCFHVVFKITGTQSLHLKHPGNDKSFRTCI